MKRLIFWGTIVSAMAAAYMMYRRGVPMSQIAARVTTHPLASLATEIKTAV